MPRARHEELVVQISGQETLIYDQKTHQAHCLNPAAAGVWKLCDGRTAVTDVASIVGRQLGIAADAEFVFCAIDQLRAADLLVEATQSALASAVSRRRVLQRLGTTGVAAALAPLVTSLMTRSAHAAASPAATTTANRTTARPTTAGPTTTRSTTAGPTTTISTTTTSFPTTTLSTTTVAPTTTLAPPM